MGKCYSMVDRGQRKKSDAYSTPYSLSWLLLAQKILNPDASTLEPCAGTGAIVSVLRDYGFTDLDWYDINPSDGIPQGDFLKETRKVSQIYTNPPFSLAYEFIKKAKEIAVDRFIFLLPLSYLHGQQRYEEIWKDVDFPLESVYVYTRYPMLGDELRADGKVRTGMSVYAQYVWDKQYYGPPSVRWLDLNSYILRRKDDCTASSGD
jgi:hypothetical protein